MSRVIEWKPRRCPQCGADWRSSRSHLVGWSNTRAVPCRTWICRQCDTITYRGDLPPVDDYVNLARDDPT